MQPHGATTVVCNDAQGLSGLFWLVLVLTCYIVPSQMWVSAQVYMMATQNYMRGKVHHASLMSSRVSYTSSDTFRHSAILCTVEMLPIVLHQVWGRCEALTAGLSSDLAEQLRLVLEPQLASKMAGEYRTGKRISMKRVIAYIASHFRKDKIWLRRTRPDKRKFQASPSNQRTMLLSC